MSRTGSGKGPRQPQDYHVGYGKPPRHTQFKPGQSGNPKGRLKGSRSLAAVVQEVLGRKIPIIERGQRKLVPASEAMLHLYLDRALKGDVKAGAFLLAALERYQPREPVQEVVDELSDQDKEIVDRLLSRKIRVSRESP